MPAVDFQLPVIKMLPIVYLENGKEENFPANNVYQNIAECKKLVENIINYGRKILFGLKFKSKDFFADAPEH